MVPGSAPRLRIGGVLASIPDTPTLSGTDTHDLIRGLLHSHDLGDEWEAFRHERHDLDLGLTLDPFGRLRLSLFFDRGAPGIAIRFVADTIPPLAVLELPGATPSLLKRPKGLFLLTGPTGSGKSTTLASMIDTIVREEARRVITIEDPIEYVYTHAAGLVTQREVGLDTESFERALIGALRQDPDVILVGEMRTLDTIQQAVRAAETGHLVFGTLHTKYAPGAVDRIIDVFPPGQQDQIRLQVSEVLLAVYAQQLVPTVMTPSDPALKALR